MLLIVEIWEVVDHERKIGLLSLVGGLRRKYRDNQSQFEFKSYDEIQ